VKQLGYALEDVCRFNTSIKIKIKIRPLNMTDVFLTLILHTVNIWSKVEKVSKGFNFYICFSQELI